MESQKWSYYQYRRQQDYPVYLRIHADEGHSKLQHLFMELGFSSLSEKDTKRISLQKPHTRMLTIQGAGARLQHQITGSTLLDQFGSESLSIQGNLPIYTYRKVGVMGLPVNKTLWDLAINNDSLETVQMVGLRIVLTRFLAFALSDLGILSYWGTVKDDTIIIMKQVDSFGEAVFLDESRNMAYWNGGEMKLPGHVKFLRKDKDHKITSKMNREELISFLSVSTCLLSFSGITHNMKRAIYSLTTRASGSYAVSMTQPTL
jgi:hypothetical protein